MEPQKDLYIPASSLLNSEETNIFEDYGDGFVGKCLDNRYDIIGMLASGGMGDVYLARQRGVGQEVAVKKLHDKFYEDPNVVDRFIDEARSYARIIHPNAVKLHDLLNVKGQICIVMEYVHGKTLTTYIDRGYVFSIRQIVEIGVQLADVLGTVHNAGIIHRDLKAENIMLVETVGNRFSVKILDFGIAKILGKTHENTNCGMVVGSPQFMSPEQCYGREVDARSDIYAFGILQYLMLCGKLPFNASKPKELMEMQCAAPVPEMRRPDFSEIPKGLESIILKCLEKDPDNRYASFAEVITDLTSFQEGKTPCIAQSMDHHVTDMMAAIAAAEKELTNKHYGEKKEFALDNGHETTITKSPRMRFYRLKRRIHSWFADKQTAPQNAPPQTGIWDKLQEFSHNRQHIILISLFATIVAVIIFFVIVQAMQTEDEIYVKQTRVIAEEPLPQPETIPPVVQESNDNPQEIDGEHGIDGESLVQWDAEETIPKSGHTLYPPEMLDPADPLIESFISTILSTAQRLNDAGNPDAALIWIDMAESAELTDKQKTALSIIKAQNQKYTGMLRAAHRFQQNGTCSKIDSLLQELPQNAEGMRASLQKLKDCEPRDGVKTPKTPAKAKSQKTTKKSSTRRKSSSGFDWSSIKTN